ncbi:histidine phosphotransferase family protein [Yoonia sp. 208BN28-4]|uniref:histidine phosphotransferase family protein n=1 Tax=Yoonia sp. 208BN28-4 TaxID=3126505 RepID=UPI0030AC02FE
MRNDLAALVGSRICHDLISPLGAIGNGVELLTLTNGDTDAEIALINDSVENANARIRFFRIAYGAARAEQFVPRTEVLSVLADTARGGRFGYVWKVEGDQPRPEVRIAFLLLQCVESGLPAGGDIQISEDHGTWQIVGTGPRKNIDQVLWETLTNPRLKFSHSAAQVQFAMLPEVARDARRTLSIDLDGDHIIARF